MSSTIHSLSLFHVYGYRNIDKARAPGLGLHCCAFFTSTSLSESPDRKTQVTSRESGYGCVIGEHILLLLVPSLATHILHASLRLFRSYTSSNMLSINVLIIDGCDVMNEQH